MSFQKVNSLGNGELTVTGRGGGIKQRPSWDGDPPFRPPPSPGRWRSPRDSVRATLVPTRGVGKRPPWAPGELERFSKGGRVAILEQVPGSRPAARWTNRSRSARTCAPAPLPPAPGLRVAFAVLEDSPSFCLLLSQSLSLPLR